MLNYKGQKYSCFYKLLVTRSSVLTIYKNLWNHIKMKHNEFNSKDKVSQLILKRLRLFEDDGDLNKLSCPELFSLMLNFAFTPEQAAEVLKHDIKQDIGDDNHVLYILLAKLAIQAEVLQIFLMMYKRLSSETFVMFVLLAVIGCFIDCFIDCFIVCSMDCFIDYLLYQTLWLLLLCL